MLAGSEAEPLEGGTPTVKSQRLVLTGITGTLGRNLIEEVQAWPGVKVLALSHFVPGDDPLVTDDNWTADVKKNFSGRIVVAKDLMQLALPV